MMKRFISALLGSLAAIWISILLFIGLFCLLIMAVTSDSLPRKIISDNFKPQTVLHIILSGDIPDRKTPGTIIEEIADISDEGPSLEEIIKSLDAATSDYRIEGVLLDCKGSNGSLAARDEIISAINRFKMSGKWVIAYADNYTQSDYYIATVADKIYLNPVGMVDIHGLSATTMFYKGLLDKLGVEMQIIKVGTYKSAVEPFTLTAPSEPSRRQQEVFLGRMWEHMSAQIAQMRDVSVNDVNQWADQLILTASGEEYLASRIVDELRYRPEIEEMIKSRLGIDSKDKLRTISAEDYCMVADVPHFKKNANKIAVLYAEGEIVDDGKGGIVSSTLVPEINKITNDSDIDALVLRVNSGGGSAFASEQIWEALEKFKATGRPLYVSMGNYAASGGYYISCGADKIFADAMTLTGSIGIFGMIPCTRDLLNKHLGVTTSTVSTNSNGNFPSITEPMTLFQRNKMQAEINRGYELFVSRCAKGRNMSVDSIKAIAEGRVWDGETAREIGLVDYIGSLHDAIWSVAGVLNFGSNFSIVEYPQSSDISAWAALTGMRSRMETATIRTEIGDAYSIYQNIKRIGDLSPIQSRMEDIKVY